MENNMTTASIRLDAEVEALLSAAGLPSSDIPGHPSLDLLGVKDGDNRLAGVIGIEQYGEIGMLRSLAVAASQRGSGIGQQLVHDAEAWAASQGINTIYLLTPTASAYFARFGYQTMARSEAPAVIAATAQFTGLCKASAQLMRKALNTLD